MVAANGVRELEASAGGRSGAEFKASGNGNRGGERGQGLFLITGYRDRSGHARRWRNGGQTITECEAAGRGRFGTRVGGRAYFRHTPRARVWPMFNKGPERPSVMLARRARSLIDDSNRNLRALSTLGND